MGGPSSSGSSSSVLAPFHVGSFYEIDHAGLPPDAPAQLKSIRVVMVTDKTELGLTANFPSVLSLREYFHNIDTTDCYGSPASGASSSPGLLAGGRGKQKLRHILTGPRPELDGQFMVGAAQAARVLRREVPLRELHNEQHLPAFWIVGSSFSSTGMMGEEEEDQEEEQEEEEDREQEQEQEEDVGHQVVVAPAPAPPPLEEALRLSADVKRWGTRKKVRHMEDISHSTQQLPELKWGKAVKAVKEEKRGQVMKAVKAVKEEPLDEDRDGPTRGLRRKKRKVVASRKGGRKKQATERSSVGGMVSGKWRWSPERYAAAEQKLFDILRQMGAVRGHPVPRSRLREEARKHIGDTGLLDHLLKHMTGKIGQQGGHERFRRRHDPDGGGMEYWLEDARLLGEDDDPKRKAGEPLCWRDVCDIRDDISQLKRDVKQLLQKQQQEDDEQGRSETVVEEEAGRGMAEEVAKREEELLSVARDTAAATSTQLLQKQQRQVMEWKGGVEGRLSEMHKSLNQTKEEMRQMREDVLLLKEQNQQLMSLIMQQFNGNHQLPSPENNTGSLHATATDSSTGGGWVTNGTMAQTSQSDEDIFSMNTSTMVTARGSYAGTTSSKAWNSGTGNGSCGMGMPTMAIDNRVMQDAFLWQGGGSGTCRAFDPCGGSFQLRGCPSQGVRTGAGAGWPLCSGPQVPFHGAPLPMQFPLPTQVPPPSTEQ